jgi:PKD repeat protein
MRPLAALALPPLLAISTLLGAFLLLGGPSGCSDDEVSPRASEGPTADFSCPARSGTAPLTVALVDESTPGSSPITDWLWSFGDGSTSGDPDPAHTYTTAGRYTVSLTVTTAVGTDTKSEEEYIVALSGDEPPECTIDDSILDFGSVTLGEFSERTFTISNDGGGTLTGSVTASCADFTIVSGDGEYSLAAGETHQVRVRFAPQSEGTESCTIETGSECIDVSCTGVGVEERVACTVEPTSLDFGSVPALIGRAERTFTITNTGDGLLAGAVSEPCGDYSILGEARYSLSAGESHAVTIRFAPSATGSRTCTIDPGSDICANVSCTGIGLGPECSVRPTSLDFGTVGVGRSEERTFTIQNTAGGLLEGRVNESCPDYRIVSGGGDYSLGPGGTRSVTVRFEPSSLGIKDCTIDLGNSRCADVDCTGIGAGIRFRCRVEPTSIDFGSVAPGGFGEESFTITNNGDGEFEGSVDESCDDYRIASGGGSYTLAPGRQRTVTVRFEPSHPGPQNCTIETGFHLCEEVSCTGTSGGAVRACDIEPRSIDFGVVAVGSSRDRTFTITNNFFDRELNGRVRTEGCGPAYEIISGEGFFTLAPGASLMVTVRFAPSSIGQETCTITTLNSFCPEVDCTGSGGLALPACEVEPTSINFGDVLLGVAKDRSFTITNIGTITLNGTVSETCSHYSIVSGAGSYTLAPGAIRTVTVRFRPTTLGIKLCTIDAGHFNCEDVRCRGSAY